MWFSTMSTMLIKPCLFHRERGHRMGTSDTHGHRLLQKLEPQRFSHYCEEPTPDTLPVRTLHPDTPGHIYNMQTRTAGCGCVWQQSYRSSRSLTLARSSAIFSRSTSSADRPLATASCTSVWPWNRSHDSRNWS